MQVDILFDEFTDCLLDQSTGELVNTEYFERYLPISKSDYTGWRFDWGVTQENGYTIYELFVEGDDEVQGRISLKIDGGIANVDIVETAPHNYGSHGRYKGVGGHLFAIACQVSIEAGCDGVVAFDSKTDLVEYYKKELHAVEIYLRRMVIFEDAAQILLDKYIRK